MSFLNQTGNSLSFLSFFLSFTDCFCVSVSTSRSRFRPRRKDKKKEAGRILGNSVPASWGLVENRGEGATCIQPAGASSQRSTTRPNVKVQPLESRVEPKPAPAPPPASLAIGCARYPAARSRRPLIAVVMATDGCFLQSHGGARHNRIILPPLLWVDYHSSPRFLLLTSRLLLHLFRVMDRQPLEKEKIIYIIKRIKKRRPLSLPLALSLFLSFFHSQ